MTRGVFLTLFCLLSTVARAGDDFTSRANAPGAGLGPAALPSGATAVYAAVGIPDIQAGFRQGLGKVELEGRANFNDLDIALAFEGLAKLRVIDAMRYDFAPYLGLGFVWNGGATYADVNNAAYVALRIVAGGTTTYVLTPHLRAVGNLEVPIDAITAPVGTVRARPLIGAGLEFSVSDAWSLFLLAQAGLDFRAQPLQAATVDFAYGVRLGVGYRLF